ncbi:NAD-dependent DNA ligase LigA [Hoylesella timonensis]|uniref:NAD-dependent DNA ligase LigA n=1 Tax=Hoylesella timonensis TaxID=386414 RepID=UPI00336A05CE
MDIQQRMRKLVDKLNLASDNYYGGKPELMTDYEWDALFDELKQLEMSSGVVLPDSPTNRVSDGAMNGKKEAHEFPALSLAKTKQPADLVKWAEGKPVWLSWKLDGLTLVVTYDGGRLSKVVTRGNGHIGTNITHLAKAIGGMPATIPFQGHTVIRGEAVISYADFEVFNLEYDDAYANPRNLASGSLTLKDVKEVERRHIQWIPFTLVFVEQEIGTWGEQMDWLEQQGFHPVERERINEPSLPVVEQVIEHWTEKVTQKTNPFPVDGLVVVFDDISFAATGSVTGHHATRAGLAFKWQDEAATTTLRHIEWSCAASTISPVAVFTPVELEGTTVQRASLCNISECKRLGIGGPGSTLSVIKANKIIPKVIRVIQSVGTFDIPKSCPVCHHEAVVRESAVSGTLTLHCTNEACPAKQIKKFDRFVSKAGMNIDGISEQTLDKFINLGWIETYADIYRLSAHAAELALLEGFGEKSMRNIMQSVEKSRTVEARHFLYALSIPLCGVDVCKRLLETYPLAELISVATTAPSLEAFAHIPGIGPEKSASLVTWFQDEANQRIVNDLLNEVQIEEPSLQPQGARCQGMTFVITGDVHHYKNRAELKSYIESQGGKVTGSVSKSTTYLINNDVNSTSGKNKKAKDLGISIISEDEFVERYG